MIEINVRMIIAWSWNILMCSIVGEEESWNEMAFQFGIIVYLLVLQFD